MMLYEVLIAILAATTPCNCDPDPSEPVIELVQIDQGVYVDPATVSSVTEQREWDYRRLKNRFEWTTHTLVISGDRQIRIQQPSNKTTERINNGRMGSNKLSP